MGLSDVHLICNKDLDCSSKIVNSVCDRNSSCVCERGYRYYSKFNKCVFSNHFHCNTVQQCATLDPRLTCVDSYCTCKEKEKRTDNYLCTAFRKYCYKGYRYNVETTDCVFVGDLTVNQLESLDQSVEIFVIVLFFITSALFIASCINNYQNERREKLRRRIAQQQTMSLFAEQRRLNMNSPSITEVVSLANDPMYANHLRNGSARHHSSANPNRHHHRYQQDYEKANVYEDNPPSYEDLFPKSDESKFQQQTNPLALTANNVQQINFAIIEGQQHHLHHHQHESSNNNLDDVNLDDVNSSTNNNQPDPQYYMESDNYHDHQMTHNNQTESNISNSSDNVNQTLSASNNENHNMTNKSVNKNDNNSCHLNDDASGNDTNNNMHPLFETQR